jgi:hypothetical protein
MNSIIPSEPLTTVGHNIVPKEVENRRQGYI